MDVLGPGASLSRSRRAKGAQTSRRGAAACRGPFTPATPSTRMSTLGGALLTTEGLRWRHIAFENKRGQSGHAGQRGLGGHVEGSTPNSSREAGRGGGGADTPGGQGQGGRREGSTPNPSREAGREGCPHAEALSTDHGFRLRAWVLLHWAQPTLQPPGQQPPQRGALGWDPGCPGEGGGHAQRLLQTLLPRDLRASGP